MAKDPVQRAMVARLIYTAFFRTFVKMSNS